MGRYMYGKDKSGRDIQWEKIRNDRNLSEFNQLLKQYIAHVVEKVDASAGRKGVVMVTDANGARLANVNMDCFKFKIELNSYYPESLKNNFVVDLSWMLSGVAKIILSLCDRNLRERVRFISRRELTKFIDLEFIPVELDGKRDTKLVIPEGVKSMRELDHLDLNDKVIKKYYKCYNHKI